jgi:Tfp pilus assembly protein PilF
MGARKPTPVDVVFFPKRAAKAERSGTKTIPEIALPEVAAQAAAPAQVKKRTRSGEHRRNTPREVLPRGGDSLPTDALADMVALGHELFSMGKVNEARVVFEGLVISNPDDSFAHTMLGTIHLARNDLDAALGAFEKAISLDPDDVPARVYRGEIRLNKRKLRGAAEDFAWALKLAAESDPFAERARRLLRLTRRASRG